MKLLKTVLIPLALVLSAPWAAAQAPDVGPYAVAAVGRTSYDADCYYFDCERARATSGKLILGYQFEVFGVEGWVGDWGQASLSSQAWLRLRTVGVNAVWRKQFGASLKGLMRAGVAQVRHERSDDGTVNHAEGTFGLALVLDLTPAASLEAAWDLSNATGKNRGNVLAQTVTLGLRLRF